MSYTALIEFKNNTANSRHEFKNSWFGLARVMETLFEKYIPKKHEYDGWLSAGQDGRMWKVCNNKNLSQAERLVYAFCCDNALVKQENFQEMAKALREFVQQNPPKNEHCCHLSAFAKVFEESNAEAIGLYGTSVCQNPWMTQNPETQEYEPYNLTTGTKHWFVFDNLKSFKANRENE